MVGLGPLLSGEAEAGLVPASGTYGVGYARNHPGQALNFLAGADSFFGFWFKK